MSLQMLAVGLVSRLIYKALKGATVRPRPCQTFNDIHRHAPMLDLYSFPSGHTMHAVGFAAVILGHYPAPGLLIAPFVPLIAASRLVLGLHCPSDVVVGAVIGGAVAWSSFIVLGRSRGRHEPSTRVIDPILDQLCIAANATRLIRCARQRTHQQQTPRRWMPHGKIRPCRNPTSTP